MSPTKLHVFGGSTGHQKVGMCMIQGCANLWSTSMSFLLVTCDAARGLQCRKRPATDGLGINRLVTHSFKPTMTHVMNFFPPFPVVKQKHVEGNTGCIGFPHLFIGFTSMMTQICSRNRPHRVVKYRMSSYELNPPKQKGVNLEGLGG